MRNSRVAIRACAMRDVSSMHKAVNRWRGLVACFAVAVTVVGPVSEANGISRQMPVLYSYYMDDGSCAEQVGESTQTVIWRGRPWNLTALTALVSPRSETRRNGTPLDIRP